MDSDSDFDANELLDYSSDEYAVKTEDEESSDDEQDSFSALPSGSTDPGSRRCPGVNLADVTDVGGPNGIPEFRPEYLPGIQLDKALVIFCGIITGCYCCCCCCMCCNFCCGKCRPGPPSDEGDYANLHDEAGTTPEDEVVTSQPIVLGPPAACDNKKEEEEEEAEGMPDERTNLQSGGAQATYGADESAGASGDTVGEGSGRQG